MCVCVCVCVCVRVTVCMLAVDVCILGGGACVYERGNQGEKLRYAMNHTQMIWQEWQNLSGILAGWLITLYNNRRRFTTFRHCIWTLCYITIGTFRHCI